MSASGEDLSSEFSTITDPSSADPNRKSVDGPKNVRIYTERTRIRSMGSGQGSAEDLPTVRERGRPSIDSQRSGQGLAEDLSKPKGRGRPSTGSQRSRSIPTVTRIKEPQAESNLDAIPESSPTDGSSRGRRLSRGTQIRNSKSVDTLSTAIRKEPEVTRHMLLKEALYTSVHMLGHPSKRFPATAKDMLTYTQITFASSPKVRHLSILRYCIHISNMILRVHNECIYICI